MSRTIALVTLYNPDESVVSNVRTISRQVDKVYLCDNSKTNNSTLFCTIDNSTYITVYRNLGISGAFNFVLKNYCFNWKNDDFIIFFDQDSRIGENHIKNLEREFYLLQNKGVKIGCIGPVYYNRSSGKIEIPHKKKRLTEHTFSVTSIITSSMLTTYERIERIGFFNEEIFLDYADWDLCWRLIKDRKKCCVTDAAILDHAVGNGDKQVASIRIRMYPQQREYYQVRDGLYLIKKKYTPCKDKIMFIKRITIDAFVHCLLLGGHKERAGYIMKGYKDYRHNITGELN